MCSFLRRGSKKPTRLQDRTILLPGLALLLFPGFQQAAMGATATDVLLAGLPEKARVYVDQHPVQARQNTVKLAPGWHVIQVERVEPGQVSAVRRLVNVPAAGSLSVPIQLRPLAGPEARPGPPGPRGPRGPIGRPAEPGRPSTELTALERLANEALATLCADAEARLADLHNRFWLDIPMFYWAEPQQGEAAPDTPPGPSGAAGPAGPIGLPGGILLIQDERGAPMLEALKGRCGLQRLDATLTGLERRAPSLPAAGWDAWRIKLLATPGAAGRLLLASANFKAGLIRLAGPTLVRSPWGAQGLAGAPGPRGDDGPVPASATPVRLSRQTAEALLTAAGRSQETRDRLVHLKAQAADLELWLSESEQRNRSTKANN